MAVTHAVTDDGVGLHVVERGDPAAPVTVVLVHGWTLDHGIWHRQLADLPAAAGVPVRLLAVDLRGHGRSEPTPAEAATIAQLGDDLAALLRQCAPSGRVVLAGHSIGGMAIMALAERHPEVVAQRVGGIAFVATSGGGLGRPGYALPAPLQPLARGVERRVLHRVRTGRAARMAARNAHARVERAIFRAGVRWLLFGRGCQAEDLDRTARAIASTPPTSVLAFRATFRDHERLHALGTCQGIPTVVLGGSADRLCPPPHTLRLAAAVPGARLALLARAGHMLSLERAGEVTRELAALVRAAQPTPVPTAGAAGNPPEEDAS